ncbi:UDP-N-acetylmuramoyl-tripeptide--D-alanyl-D-alanine ligase [Pasteurella canis]|uniref:UDP-N-acetylmuramoyl-tripeptide--D-alanyl-D- alanine ligase n=1 Tax=Pasteurella canis TaxID=753 RepID=UPI001CC0BC1D|nr:UDP-N-acetylmuramoyl-tripeptide--D-alanyl-D-alanine ligase [Pasteurella canis]UAX41375.1 UDP-N-acetylmuramoyl-tripeptide--D-alanyl-D-alanine ligase [Pasteurella canis]
MLRLTTKQLADILHARLVGSPDVVIQSINTDTRQAVSESLFFALKGEHFDAHNYLVQAIEQGACALVVEQVNLELSVPQLIVEDTRLALGKLAKWVKTAISPLTVAMTGSSGKTTVKEMTASILQSAVGFDKVLFTQGNFNNDIGVPLTLLRLTEQHRFAVIELGANHQGEIAYTTDLVQPNVALVNNVAAAHLEGFGSLDGVAKAKGEIFRGLPADGIAIINKDHDYSASMWAVEIGERQRQYFAYQDTEADFYADNIRFTESGSVFDLHTPAGQIQIKLPYLGEHNIKNALAATALTMNVGANLEQVKQGLEVRSQVKGRLFPIQPCTNLLLLDDTYNANVDSLQSAINVLKKYSAFRILVVGDMAELGENTQFCHQQVANYAKAAELELVLSFGSESASISQACFGQHFTEKAELCAYLMTLIKEKLKQNQKIVLLAKGSRRMKMEDVINTLKDNFVC